MIEQAVADPIERAANGDSTRRAAAWRAWAAGIQQWGKAHLPPGHVVDDSRESIYEGRE